MKVNNKKDLRTKQMGDGNNKNKEDNINMAKANCIDTTEPKLGDEANSELVQVVEKGIKE